jgi:hypothetical protein
LNRKISGGLPPVESPSPSLPVPSESAMRRGRAVSGRPSISCMLPAAWTRDLENPERYLETFLVDSWAEHLRQHERSTRADRAVTERVRSFTTGEPIVRHLLYATANSAEQKTEHSHQTQVGRVAPESL